MNDEDHDDEDSFCTSTSSVGALSDVMGSSNDIINNLNQSSSEKNVEDHNDEDSLILFVFFNRSVGAFSDVMGMSYDINRILLSPSRCQNHWIYGMLDEYLRLEELQPYLHGLFVVEGGKSRIMPILPRVPIAFCP